VGGLFFRAVDFAVFGDLFLRRSGRFAPLGNAGVLRCAQNDKQSKNIGHGGPVAKVIVGLTISLDGFVADSEWQRRAPLS
jgi:hypothetical protein